MWTCKCRNRSGQYIGWGYPSDNESDKRVPFCKDCNGRVRAVASAEKEER